MAFAPAAHAAPPAVSVQVSPGSGAAPLQVTLTASGDLAAVSLGPRRRRHRRRPLGAAHVRSGDVHRAGHRHERARRGRPGDRHGHLDRAHARGTAHRALPAEAAVPRAPCPGTEGRAAWALPRRAADRDRAHREGRPFLRARPRRHSGPSVHRPLRRSGLECGHARRAARARHRVSRVRAAGPPALVSRPLPARERRQADRPRLAR